MVAPHTRHLCGMDTFTGELQQFHNLPQRNKPYHEIYMQSFVHIPFLDVNISILNDTITTDLYTKPTNKHRYFLHSSCHPLHTKRSIPFNLALGLRRIGSTNETFTLHTNELITCLHQRGYNLHFLKQEIRRVHNIERDQALLPIVLLPTHSKNQNVFHLL